MFSKGESVTFTDQGIERHGVIDVAGRKQVTIFCIHSGVVKRAMVPLELVRYSSQPVPAILKTSTAKIIPFKKNDRVIWERDGKTIQGFVSKLKGEKLEVSFLSDDDKKCVVGHTSLFKLNPNPLPKCEPSPMDGYSITRLGGHMSRCEGYVANGTIKTPSGEKIEFEDDSHGGETEYWSKTDGSGNLVRKFKQDSAAWWQKYSKGSALMAETMWIDWYGYDRLCGLTDKEYIENYEKSFVSR